MSGCSPLNPCRPFWPEQKQLHILSHVTRNNIKNNRFILSNYFKEFAYGVGKGP